MGVSLEPRVVGDNRPARHAGFPAGNIGSDARDGTGAAREFQWGESLRATRSPAIIHCNQMGIGLAGFHVGQHRDLEIVSIGCQSS
jgi:hypothetical protein